MSNLISEKEYDNFKDLLDFIFHQQMKAIYACLPGLIVQYNASTKRAIIKIAINLLFTDGSRKDYPLIGDVPVIFPSGGGFNINLPLQANDAVLILFSQRSLDNFKSSFSLSDVTETGFFSFKDAICLPGFGELQQTPATAGALNLQDNSANNFISITDNGIIIDAPTVTINGDILVTGEMTVTGDVVGGAGGVSLQSHVHGGVTTGGGNTGVPVT